MNSRTIFKWPILKFSTTASRYDPKRVLDSGNFRLTDSNMKFCLRFRPTNATPNFSYEYSSLFLVAKEFDGAAFIDLKYKLWIENTDGTKIPDPTSGMSTHKFEKIDIGWGWSEFAHHDRLYSEENSFVKHDMIFLCCEVQLLPPETIEVNSQSEADIKKKEWALYQEGYKDSCVIQVGDQKFPIEKKKLMTISAVFERIFKSEVQKTQARVIQMDEVSSATVDVFIQYLHLYDLANLDGEAFGLYKLAHTYEIADLKKRCSTILLDDLNSDNVFDRMVLAFKHNDPILKRGVFDYLADRPVNFKQIMISSEWKEFMNVNVELSHEIINEFFKIMNLN
jgi:hypothetical protein